MKTAHTRATILIALSALTAGCGQTNAAQSAGTPTRTVDPNYTPPAWMAETKTAKNEFAQAVVECLAALDIPAHALQFGGIAADNPTTETQHATQNCAEEIGYPHVTEPQEEYKRLGDINECLKAQGFATTKMPTETEWLASLDGVEAPWTPYSMFLGAGDNAAQPTYQLTDTELSQLQDICVPSQYGQIVQTTEG